MVGKGQFNMLTRILNGSQIHIVPRWSTCFNLSSLVPIEGHKILTQARASGCIHNIQAKTNVLVALNLEINISSIYSIIRFLKANQLLNNIT